MTECIYEIARALVWALFSREENVIGADYILSEDNLSR